MMHMTFLALIALLMTLHSSLSEAKQKVRVATFNVSMEGANYVKNNASPKGLELIDALNQNHPQIRNIAEIIQRVRPDVLVLNEFDYQHNPDVSVMPFIRNFLNVGQSSLDPIDFPYFYTAAVNTGVSSGVDLNGDGRTDGPQDAYGYGHYPGQYGMLILSRYPIIKNQIRTFQHFLWKDMPGNLLSEVKASNGRHYYSAKARQKMRLSSKSHWDIPIKINKQQLHMLVSHPTPPVFDGPEDRNGKRNHDEIRFWQDYLSGGRAAAYIYDDKNIKAGFKGERFVIAGDLNSSVNEGDSLSSALSALFTNPKVNADFIPTSPGGAEHSAKNPLGKYHTTGWRMRADYILPSTQGIKILNGGVFWPLKTSEEYRLVADRQASSDHRLVWLDIELLAIK